MFTKCEELSECQDDYSAGVVLQYTEAFLRENFITSKIDPCLSGIYHAHTWCFIVRVKCYLRADASFQN